MKRFLVTLAFACGVATLSAQQQFPITIDGAQNPTQTAGASATTFGPGGLIAQGRSTTDTATLNTWNPTSVTIPANMLNATSDTLIWEPSALGANNTNTHEFQVWFAPSTATCSGTNANLCDAGCAIIPSGVTNTTAFAFYNSHIVITRVTSSTQDFSRTHGGTSLNWTTGNCTIDLTLASKLVWGIRNTTAGAASLGQLTYWVWFNPHP